VLERYSVDELWRFARHRLRRWLNNRVEHDHRRIKRLTRPMLGFQGFWTAKRTLACIEAMAPCPRATCRRSDPLYNRSSALLPE
jgi:transposase, IS6 family